MDVKKLQPISIEHNVSIDVIDERTGRVVQHHEGHNAATNSAILGIAKYLIGDGVFNQGKDMLRNYVPQYISLGTLGLHSQDQDEHGLPTGIGPDPKDYPDEGKRFSLYMAQNPGYGADGYSQHLNNSRTLFGLGLPYTDYLTNKQYKVDDHCMYRGTLYVCIAKGGAYGSWNPSCWRPEDGEDPTAPHFGELITPTFPRVKISYREVVPEQYSELPCTIDVIYSAMISTGALSQFRYGDNDYIFITEAGLWSRPTWEDNGANGLIAGYRLAPPSKNNWAMTAESAKANIAQDQIDAYLAQHPGTSQEVALQVLATAAAAHNRNLLKQNIIRVGKNQVVQVTWKIQLGSIEQFGGISEYYQSYYQLYWKDGSELI